MRSWECPSLVSSPLSLPPFYSRQGGGLVSFVAFLAIGISIIFCHASPCDFETFHMTTTCKSHVRLVNMALCVCVCVCVCACVHACVRACVHMCLIACTAG